jgi:hypothetical protein
MIPRQLRARNATPRRMCAALVKYRVKSNLDRSIDPRSTFQYLNNPHTAFNIMATTKVALITASSAGLGAQIARSFAPDFRVVCHYSECNQCTTLPKKKRVPRVTAHKCRSLTIPPTLNAHNHSSKSFPPSRAARHNRVLASTSSKPTCLPRRLYRTLSRRLSKRWAD